MKHLTLDVFENFKCIGSDCPDTCCAGWSILVDDNSVKNYRDVSGEFGTKLNDNLITQENLTYMKLQNQRCPFLTEQELCEIYIRLGEHMMCHTCKTYPRFDNIYGNILFHGLAISCPVIARKVLSKKDPIEFDFSEISLTEPDTTTTDWAFFNTIISGLTTSVSIMQNRRMSLSQRLRLLVFFNDALQQHIDTGLDCSALFNTFSVENFEQFIPVLNNLSTNQDNKLEVFIHICKNIDVFKSPDLLTYIKTDIDNISNTNNRDSFVEEFAKTLKKYLTPELETLYEQYIIYFLFRYYMNAYSTRTPLKTITVLGYLYTFQLCLSIFKFTKENKTLESTQEIEIISKIARTFEHSANDRRLDALYDLCADNKMTDTSYLLNLLS